MAYLSVSHSHRGFSPVIETRLCFNEPFQRFLTAERELLVAKLLKQFPIV